MNGRAFLDTRALLQETLASQGCKHEWRKNDDPRWIACQKCGLWAYVPAAEPSAGGSEGDSTGVFRPKADIQQPKTA